MVAVVDIDNVNNQKESTNDSVPQLSVDMGPGDTTTQMIQGDRTPLEVYPSELRFTLQPIKSIKCLLDLTNHTYERVAFRLMQKMEKSEPLWEKENSFLSNLPIYGFTPPRSTYTLVVTKKEQPHPPEDTNLDLLLQSSISGDKFIVPFENESECVDLFEELKETGNAVHEVTLKAVSDPQGEVTHEIISATKKVDKLGFGRGLVCIDTHPTETWVLTCKFFGDVFIWDLVAQEEKEPLYSFKVKEKDGITATVRFLKFIARKQWFLAGTDEGFIHVVSYGTETVQEIMSFRASSTNVTSMAIHPTQPYVLSSAHDNSIKLWDWDKGWECTWTLKDEQSGTIRQIAFNPEDTNCFASTSDDQTVNVWSIDSPKSNYTLFGHLAQVNCLDFFTRGDQQHLISGSDDLTVRIWDLEKRACVYTISALIAPVLSVLCLPNRPYLIIGLKDGTLHLFSSANFRLERIIDFGCRKVCSVVLMGSVRVAIVQEGAVSIIDIENEKPAGIISEVRANMVDAVKLDVASEAQLEAPHIFQEPKED